MGVGSSFVGVSTQGVVEPEPVRSRLVLIDKWVTALGLASVEWTGQFNLGTPLKWYGVSVLCMLRIIHLDPSLYQKNIYFASC